MTLRDELLLQLKSGNLKINKCDVDSFPHMSDTERAASDIRLNKVLSNIFQMEITNDDTYPENGI